jgi:hypothetical protein
MGTSAVDMITSGALKPPFIDSSARQGSCGGSFNNGPGYPGAGGASTESSPQTTRRRRASSKYFGPNTGVGKGGPAAHDETQAAGAPLHPSPKKERKPRRASVGADGRDLKNAIASTATAVAEGELTSAVEVFHLKQLQKRALQSRKSEAAQAREESVRAARSETTNLKRAAYARKRRVVR